MNIFEPLTTQPPSTLGARLDARDVRAGVGLGDPSAAIFSPRIAGRGSADAGPRCRTPDRRRGDADVRADAGRQAARAAARELLGQDRVVQESPPWPPYSSGYFSPRKPSSAMRGKTSSGNHGPPPTRAACGRSSAATKRRIDSRSSSCSSVNGGVAGIAARTYLDAGRFVWYTDSYVIRSVEQTSLHAPQLYERIASRLAGEVRSGALAPGERPPASASSRVAWCVGRSSVREAIAACRSTASSFADRTQQLRRRRSRRRAAVAAEPDISPSALLEERALLEPGGRGGSPPAARGTDAEAERLLDAMEETSSLPGGTTADRLFHLRLAAADRQPGAGHARRGSIAAVMDQPLWQRLRDDSVADAAHMRIHAAEHRMIYEADRRRRRGRRRVLRRPAHRPRASLHDARYQRRTHRAIRRSHPRRHHAVRRRRQRRPRRAGALGAAHVGAGMAGFVGTGTMGEAQSLTRDERRAVIATIVETVDGRVP